MKRLNTMVTEIKKTEPIGKQKSLDMTFTAQRSGWHYMGCATETPGAEDVSFCVDGKPLGKRPIYRASAEAMVELPAGDHTLEILNPAGADLGAASIRAIPELAYCKHQYNPHISEYGPYDWDFIARHVLPHANTIVGNGDPSHEESLKWWKARGGKWILETSLHGMNDESVSAESVQESWEKSLGMVHPLMDGIMVDEFFAGRRPQFKAWRRALENVARDPRFRGKKIYPYLGSHYPDMDDWKEQKGDGDDSSYRFLASTMAAGYPIAWERYLQERHTKDCAEDLFRTRLAEPIAHWRRRFPDCARSLLVSLGYMTIAETLNVHPGADFKVFMDMQFQFLATNPDFENLFGVLEYTSGYADEETLRWAARLYRHYGIEGNTMLLSDQLGYSYCPGHIRNPDFALHWEGWQFPVETVRSLEVRSHEGFSHLQGRWQRTSVGDTFLTMKRRGKIPNIVSQEVTNLRPGRLYSAKLISGDYGELLAGKSVPRKLGISLNVQGAEPVHEKCFQTIMANNYSHELEPFVGQNRYSFNYHQVVFRAKSPSAKLSISDWMGSEGDMRPAGPEGEVLLCNFVEVQPYFGGDE